MTPGVETAEAAGIKYRLHRYKHGSRRDNYGEEAAAALGVAPARVFKTLVVALDDGTLAVAVVPVSSQLDLKAMAKTLGSKRAVMAEPKAVQRSTGYVLGGVSPLGQRTPLATVIDESATAYTSIFVSAGRRGLELELAPGDLQSLCGACRAEIAR